MRRAIKLVVHEHRITCPYCASQLIYNSGAATIVLAEHLPNVRQGIYD